MSQRLFEALVSLRHKGFDLSLRHEIEPEFLCGLADMLAERDGWRFLWDEKEST